MSSWMSIRKAFYENHAGADKAGFTRDIETQDPGMELYFPTELPEQLAFSGAALAALIGLLLFLAPSAALKIGGVSVGEVTPDGYAATRSTGGLYLGLGLTALLLAQDWTYMAVGVALATAALGRILSALADRAVTPRNVMLAILQVVISGLPLGYVFGYFSV
jgi:hypothetical protein